MLKSHKNAGYTLCINQNFTLFRILRFYFSPRKKYISEQKISFCEHRTVWDITWVSAIRWHLCKCRLQKSEILTCGQVVSWWGHLIRCLAVTWSSAGIHFVKCMDWSLIQVTSRTVVLGTSSSVPKAAMRKTLFRTLLIVLDKAVKLLQHVL